MTHFFSKMERSGVPKRKLCRLGRLNPQYFQQLRSWLCSCEYQGMSFWLILFAAQIIVTVFALVRESGKDARFEGEKLGFRS
jgi:hypothetical protein